MSITLVCPEHRTYLGKRRPRQTAKHPVGCRGCWAVHHGLIEGELTVVRHISFAPVILKVKRS